MKKDVSNQNMVDAASGLIKPGSIKPELESSTNNPAQDIQPVINPAQDVQPAGNIPLAGNVAPIVVDTPLGQQVYGAIPLDQVKLQSFADVAAFAKNHAGVEMKDVQDFVKVFDNYKNLAKTASEVVEIQKSLETYKSIINNLPEEVNLLVRASAQGEDYIPILQKLSQKAVFDFEKPITAHDILNLINHYNTKQYTVETLEALPPEAQDALHDAAKIKYEADQKEFLTLKNKVKSATENRQRNFLTSVESSIANLLTNNPKLDKAVVDRVREIMTYGLSNSLFTKEKTYLPDAAEKIAFMEFGKQTVANQAQTINQIIARVKAEGRSEVTENLLLRSDKPAPAGGGTTGLSNELQTAVEEATRFLKTK